MITDTALQVDYSLEKFTNEEFYYIISSLLGLGDPGFVPERLYLSFDQNSLDAPEEIKFLFMTSNLIQTDDGEKEVTEYTVGKIDSEFDNIEIYRWHCAPEVMSPEKTEVDVLLIKSMLREYNSSIPFRPASLLKGINKIISEDEFEKRNDNDLFNLKWHVNIPNGIRHQFDFGQMGKLETDFSGTYFLVVQPDTANLERLIVNYFQVTVLQQEGVILFEGESRDEIAQVSQRFIDSNSIQLCDDGWTGSVLTDALGQELENHAENLSVRPQRLFEGYKAGKKSALAETLVELINDLPESKRKELLNGESIERWVKYSQEKYEEEFDLHVDDLGVMGANEIAWIEALGSLGESRDACDYNWKDNFLVHQQLLEISKKISRGYAMLVSNLPGHTDAYNWQEVAQIWISYSQDIEDMFLSSEEAAEREISRLTDAYSELLNIEDKMYQGKRPDLKIIS